MYPGMFNLLAILPALLTFATLAASAVGGTLRAVTLAGALAGVAPESPAAAPQATQAAANRISVAGRTMRAARALGAAVAALDVAETARMAAPFCPVAAFNADLARRDALNASEVFFGS